MYCALPDGKKISMPRYYKNALYTKADREMVGTAIRIEQDRLLAERLLANPDHYRDTFESHKMEFQKMHDRSLRDRNKI